MLNLEQLACLAAEHVGELQAQVAGFEIGGQVFDFNAGPAVMGVVNLSADSWYRESVCLSAEAGIQRGIILHAQGAQIVDLGAESTLAQTARANAALQNSMLLPVVRGLRAANILVSVETYNAEVARACLGAGANIVNLTGPAEGNDIYRIVAEQNAAVIICHVQGANVREVADFDLSRDPIPMMHDYFARQIDKATSVGVRRIFIDPGLGFYYRNLEDSAVRVRHQMNIFLNTFRLRTLGFPICHALPHAFEFFRAEVRSAEPFFAVLAALGKTDLFRTHEVPRTRAVIETMRAI